MVVHTAIYYYKNDSNNIQTIKSEFPTYNPKEVKAELTKRWKQLTPVDKEPFNRMITDPSELEDLVYDIVPGQPSTLPTESSIELSIESLLKNHSLEMENSPVEIENSPVEVEKQFVYKKAKSSFMHYQHDPLIRDSFGLSKKTPSEFSKKWKTLTIEEKKPWVDKYEQEKALLNDNPVKVEKRVRKSKKDDYNVLKNLVDNLTKEIGVIKKQLESMKTEQ